MARLTVQNVEKSLGGKTLFSGLSLELAPGMRLCVAGPNGSGKSTFVRVLAGEERPDAGHVSVERNARVGYVAQELDEADLDSHLLAWVMDALPSWSEFWREWEAAAKAGDQAALERLGARQAELEHSLGHNPEARARAVLTGLGFAEAKFIQPLRALSGGWRERAKLARVLVAGADALLLDEPTNHLDLEAIRWLENYLLSFKGAVAFVAHDLIFMDKVATHVLFVAGGRHVFRPGDFSSFVAWEEENERLRQKEEAKLAARIEHEYLYIRRFRVKARKAAQAQSKLKRVQKMEGELDRIKDASAGLRAGQTLSFSLPDPPRSDKVVLRAENLGFAYESGAPVFQGLDFTVYRGRKIGLLGPNGRGKSTLLRIAAHMARPTSGHVHHGPKTVVGYFSQHAAEVLRPNHSVRGELRRLSDPKVSEQQICDVLGLFMLGDAFLDARVESLSGGEKSRLSMATLFLSGANFLVLDEPANHLDLESRRALMAALEDYEGAVLLVSHDRILLDSVPHELWTLTPEGVVEHDGSLEQALAEAGRGDEPEAARQSPAPERRTRERKRQEAEIRNRFSKKLNPLRERYQKLEADLEEVMGDQETLSSALSDPETYQDQERIARLTSRYSQARDKGDEVMERMQALEEDIQALEVERDRLLSG